MKHRWASEIVCGILRLMIPSFGLEVSVEEVLRGPSIPYSGKWTLRGSLKPSQTLSP